MLTRYWSLSQHGQLKDLVTKHTTVKGPITNKQAQKQTENKSLTQIFDIFQLFTGHRHNNIGMASSQTRYLRSWEQGSHTTHNCFICLSPNKKLVTVPISIVTNQPMAQYHKYDVL